MYIILLFLFLISFSLGNYLIPKIILFAKKNKILDKPDKRKQHVIPLARLGGISIFLSFLFSILLFITYLFAFESGISDMFIMKFLVLATLFFLMGIYEDFIGASPKTRLFFQFLFAFFAWIAGIRIQQIDFLLFNNEFLVNLPIILSAILTTLWIVSITNAINWLDGLDALVGGFSIINFLTLGIISFKNNNFILLVIFIILMGSCLAFLKYNWPPSKIMMGDGGSYFLGFSISVLSLEAFNINIDGQLTQDVFFPAFLLAIPVLDMARVISARLIEFKSPFYPDRKHLHHLLLNLGLSPTKTVLSIFSFLIIQSIILLNIY